MNKRFGVWLERFKLLLICFGISYKHLGLLLRYLSFAYTQSVFYGRWNSSGSSVGCVVAKAMTHRSLPEAGMV
jgi:hypothetical protein